MSGQFPDRYALVNVTRMDMVNSRLIKPLSRTRSSFLAYFRAIGPLQSVELGRFRTCQSR